MKPRGSAGVYMLSPEHADGIQRLASDPAIAAATRIPHPYPENGAHEFIARKRAQQAEGTGYGFAIVDRGEVVGVCNVSGIGGDATPTLGVWVGVPYWGKGYATFAVKMVLEFAFQNLGLVRVRAMVPASSAAARRVLEKNGFEAKPDQDLPGDPKEQLLVHETTRHRWIEQRNGPALAALHPALRAILEAELAAGNEIAETGGGWPDPDSVFVRLRHEFRTRPDPLAEDLTYTEPNDPHWWKADYSSRSPRHVLAC